MPVDSSIYGLVKPVEQRNVLAEYAQIAQIGNAQQQNTANALKLAEYQGERSEQNALARMIADPQYQKDGRFDLTAATPALYSAAPRKAGDFIKSIGDQQKTATETAEKRAQMNGHHFKLMGELTNLIAADPRPETVSAVFDQWEGLTGLKAGPSRQAFAQLGTRQQIRELALRLNLSAKEQLPKIETRDAGGQVQTLAVDPVNPQGVTVLGSVAKTATPGDLLQHQDRVASRKQAEAHFQAGQNAPQYMETSEGLVALPKKLPPGQAPTATPVIGANGEPLTKPLKPLPANVNSAIVENASSLERARSALALIRGQNVGTATGDTEATGWQGYLPGSVLNRVDPSGVDARAAIADLGSALIHQRSGAAVSAAEFPRLQPFIPLATDDAATVEKKLQNYIRVLEEETNNLSATYSKEQGYRPSPVLNASQSRATNPAGPKGGAAMALPKNPTAQTLAVGQVYQLPNGKPGRWNGQAFEVQ